jgi:predicted SprT family Zn-dependent metalloprotease
VNLGRAKELALQLMAQHGLTEGNQWRAATMHTVTSGGMPWRFVWDNSKKRFGQCRYGRREIGLSEHLTLLNDEAHVRDTILHEVAHALVGSGHGHDHVWKAMCIRIGAKPERCYDSTAVTAVQGKWQARCPGCDRVYHRHRQPDTCRKFACTICCRKYAFGRFDTRFLLKYYYGTPPATTVRPDLTRMLPAQPVIAFTPQVTFGAAAAAPAPVVVQETPAAVRRAMFDIKPVKVNNFDPKLVISLYNGGMIVSDIAQRMGYPKGHGNNRVRNVLINAGIYKGAN